MGALSPWANTVSSEWWGRHHGEETASHYGLASIMLLLTLLSLLLLEAPGTHQEAAPGGALLDPGPPAPQVREGGIHRETRQEDTHVMEEEMPSLSQLLERARRKYQDRTGRDGVDARKPSLPGRLPAWRRSFQSRRHGGTPRANFARKPVEDKGDMSNQREKAGGHSVGSVMDQNTMDEIQTTETPTTTHWESEEEEDTTIMPIDIFDGQYHEVNPGQYHEENPGQYHGVNEGQYHETNPGQYEAVVQFNEKDETQSYNVHRKTGDYIIGEVGKIDINNGQTLEGVRYTAVEGMVDQDQITEILRRYFGAGR